MIEMSHPQTILFFLLETRTPLGDVVAGSLSVDAALVASSWGGRSLWPFDREVYPPQVFQTPLEWEFPYETDHFMMVWEPSLAHVNRLVICGRFCRKTRRGWKTNNFRIFRRWFYGESLIDMFNMFPAYLISNMLQSTAMSAFLLLF